MEDGWLARLRWRRRGAWMWPSFLALIGLDGLIGTLWPPAGQSWSFVAAALFGGFANLLAIAVLSAPLRVGLRRLRPDLPRVVATDYAGTTMMVAISAILLLAGLLHRSRIEAEQRTMADVIVRAQAFIGDRAPATFRRDVRYVSVLTIQAGSIYRVCVPSRLGGQSYCVIVMPRLPFASSVRTDGHTSNDVLDQGTS